jgi:hypothetical protein
MAVNGPAMAVTHWYSPPLTSQQQRVGATH